METEEAAGCLESLGNPTRLEIYRRLVKAGSTGCTVGTIQEELAIPGSTLSHHIHHMVQRGLVSQIRDGRSLRCCANFQAMNALLVFLTEECCTDEGCC